MLRGLGPDDPAQIGDIRLIGHLGAGGFGIVYLGVHSSDRIVAVKHTHAVFAVQPEFRRRFATEIAAIARVGGERIPSLVGADAKAATPWLATEYVAGPSLQEAVHRLGPLPPQAVGAIGLAIIDALTDVHRADLLHRDLKPSNTVLGPDGPRVIDFGLARILDEVGGTATREILGSPQYMAPEQAVDLRTVGRPADVYACAATLVFAATGHAVYDVPSRLAAFEALAARRPAELHGLTPELAAVLAPCLTADPRRRPSLSELRAGIAHVAAGAEACYPDPVTELVLQHLEEVRKLVGPQADAHVPVRGTWLDPGKRAHSDDGFHLVLCRLDENGALAYILVRLFSPRLRAAPHKAPVVEVEIEAPRHGTPILALPVVAFRENADEHEWRTVNVGRCELPAGTRAKLLLELDGADGVRFLSPSLTGVDRQPWDELRRTVPGRITEAQRQDLVIAVELDGTEDSFRDRSAFVSSLLHRIAMIPESGATTRVGVIGYGDHRIYDTPGNSLEELHRRYLMDAAQAEDAELPRLLTVALGTARDALAAVAQWTPSRLRHANAAPVEEALELLWRFDWRPDAGHGLIIVGERAPHPWPGTDGRVFPCPRRLLWQNLLYAARHQFELSCVAVVRHRRAQDGQSPTTRQTRADPVAERARLVWRELGADGLFDLAYADVNRVLAAAGFDPVRATGLRRIPLAFPVLE